MYPELMCRVFSTSDLWVIPGVLGSRDLGPPADTPVKEHRGESQWRILLLAGCRAEGQRKTRVKFSTWVAERKARKL